jgi:hypothetical protein
MSQPERSGAATDLKTTKNPKTKEPKTADEVDEDTLSPLDPDVEARINAAVHDEERQGTEGS